MAGAASDARVASAPARPRRPPHRRVGGQPASAMSCARHGDGSPTAIAAGTEQLAGDARFFDSWPHLLLGRVVGVATDENRRSPAFGRTFWTVEVAAALGGGEMPSRVVVGAPDDGGNGGYSFTLGDAFAIPVRPSPDLGGWSSLPATPSPARRPRRRRGGRGGGRRGQRHPHGHGAPGHAGHRCGLGVDSRTIGHRRAAGGHRRCPGAGDRRRHARRLAFGACLVPTVTAQVGARPDLHQRLGSRRHLRCEASRAGAAGQPTEATVRAVTERHASSKAGT